MREKVDEVVGGAALEVVGGAALGGRGCEIDSEFLKSLRDFELSISAIVAPQRSSV